MIDTLKSTRLELERFYADKIDNCKIIYVETRKYPSRGDYTIFYTDCTPDYYPIFIEKARYDTTDYKRLFDKGIRISKEANSQGILITNNGSEYQIRIRNPKTEDDRWFGTRVALIFFTIATILIIILPNSLYDKYLNS